MRFKIVQLIGGDECHAFLFQVCYQHEFSLPLRCPSPDHRCRHWRHTNPKLALQGLLVLSSLRNKSGVCTFVLAPHRTQEISLPLSKDPTPFQT